MPWWAWLAIALGSLTFIAVCTLLGWILHQLTDMWRY